jgi:hypothetical protein
MLDAILEALADHPADYGLTMTEIVALPKPLSSMFRGMVRRRTLNATEMANILGLEGEDMPLVLEHMLAKHLVDPLEDPQTHEIRYRVVLVHTRHRALKQ